MRRSESSDDEAIVQFLFEHVHKSNTLSQKLKKKLVVGGCGFEEVKENF